MNKSFKIIDVIFWVDELPFFKIVLKKKQQQMDNLLAKRLKNTKKKCSKITSKKIQLMPEMNKTTNINT